MSWMPLAGNGDALDRKVDGRPAVRASRGPERPGDPKQSSRIEEKVPNAAGRVSSAGSRHGRAGPSVGLAMRLVRPGDTAACWLIQVGWIGAPEARRIARAWRTRGGGCAFVREIAG
jgi:hypothetical protein